MLSGGGGGGVVFLARCSLGGKEHQVTISRFR